jgi:signal transduction histidine kinase
MGPANMVLSGQLGAITERQKEHLTIVQTYSRRLLRLINTLLDLSKVDAGKATLLLERGNFAVFARQIIHSAIPMAETKSLQLSFEADNSIPEFLFDPGKMEDVFINLISNAIKFTERGEIRVSCVMQWNNVLVEISDTGCGIPQETFPKIFDRFFQVDSALTRGGVGTGIGLALVKEWVELHAGRVWVKSEEGHGSTFSFIIPIRLEEIVEGKGEPHRVRSRFPDLTAFELSRTPEAETWRKLPFREGLDHILLVDDNPDMLHFMVDQLRVAYNLSLAKDGEEGILLAKSEHPDLIISDIMMPIKDGYQLCRELKEDPKTAAIPIVLLTAKGSLSDKIEGLEQGADDYLTKPFYQEELRARVLSLLHKRRLQKALEEKAEELSHSNAGLLALRYAVSHDLRSPLRAIEGFTAILAQNHEIRMDPDGRHCLEVIRESTKQMGQKIDDLIRFSQWGDLPIKAEAVDMETLARLVSDKLTSAEPTRAIQVTIHPLPFTVGDQTLLNQVWINLIGNAIKYTRPKSTAVIEVGVDQEGDFNRYYVKDNGVGFDMRFVDQLFKVVQRLHSMEEFEGTGLGLALVERLIHRHGGRVWAEGTVNKGATFYFTLPKEDNSKVGDMAG